MPKIGLQLYSVRHDYARNYKETLEEVAAAGYEGVEFAGLYGSGAEELRDLLRTLGLEPAGAHIGLNDILDEAKAPSTILFQKTIGNQNIVVPILPAEYRETRETWLSASRVFGALSKKLGAQDLRLGYHNHRLEFEAKFNGTTAWELFFQNTPSDVFIQLDIGHAVAAGNTTTSLVELTRKFPGRIKSIHAKDYSRTHGYNVYIGEGDVDWNEILGSLKHLEWIIVEQEEYKQNTPIEAAKTSLQNLKEILKRLQGK